MLSSLFFGTPSFVIPALEKIYKHSHLKAIFTSPDKAVGRSNEAVPTAPKLFAFERQIPVFQPSSYKNNEEILQLIRHFHADVAFVIAYGFILPKPVLDSLPLGFYNYHASILPKYRGASPIQSALLSGDSETGISVQKLDEKMDTGDILLQKIIPILPEDDRISMDKKLSQLSADCTLEVISILESKDYRLKTQDHQAASYCKKINKEDGLVDPSNDNAIDIFNKVRAYAGWPTAYFHFNGKLLHIHKASLVDNESGHEKPTIMKADKSGFWISTRKGILSLIEVQFENRKRLHYIDFLNGNALKEGDEI